VTFDYHVHIPFVLYAGYLVLMFIFAVAAGVYLSKKVALWCETIENIVIVHKSESIEK
jgi:hypothetical protein